jgi:glycosyltransferase involved in cell wall biosynthesis
MTHIFINGIAASAGGGLTYLRNVVPRLAARQEVRVTALLNTSFRAEFKESRRLSILNTQYPASSTLRFFFEQYSIPRMIRECRADVLLSPGNFAVFRSPVPQILLSRNALYTSADFERDLLERREYKMWLDNRVKRNLARWSIDVSDCTVAPSEAFACELERWVHKTIVAIHHGFDQDAFFADQAALPPNVAGKLASAHNSLRLLFVSHYNYYRNFETLIRAIAILKKKLHPRTVRLVLTCTLNSQENPGTYRAESAASLVRQLGLQDEIVELGAIPYNALHHVYRACDLYVTPAYAETFAHPLVEAMASGRPVIASDLDVHREICGNSAVYFPKRSPEILADTVLALAGSARQAAVMREAGLRRSQDFSWEKHVEELLRLARALVNAGSNEFEDHRSHPVESPAA